MENLHQLIHLDTLNMSNNLIKKIEGISMLEKITTLTLAHNFLQTADDLRGILDCPSLWYYDMNLTKS